MNVAGQKTLIDVLPKGPRDFVDPHDTVDPFPGMLERILEGYRPALEVVEAAEVRMAEYGHPNCHLTPNEESQALLDALRAWKAA